MVERKAVTANLEGSTSVSKVEDSLSISTPRRLGVVAVRPLLGRSRASSPIRSHVECRLDVERRSSDIRKGMARVMIVIGQGDCAERETGHQRDRTAAPIHRPADRIRGSGPIPGRFRQDPVGIWRQTDTRRIRFGLLPQSNKVLKAPAETATPTCGDLVGTIFYRKHKFLPEAGGWPLTTCQTR